ncbi:DUF805 domain-containing protein [Streptomyces sp. NP160]|uniref:DUF805 domain-containing protein n=1 Tax=Streptomyces sp. NP160 TaxID=2586637 RepID=UPI00111B2FA1|nr:DUF805 domain-containing protein [Streptomyces sp. NP160]TNM59444.1 DUF805 domain-containing protein [Streptomyces sp. NP160]
MPPVQAVTSALRQYAVFSGRATRSELWWFFGAYFAAAVVASVVDSVLFVGVLGVPVTPLTLLVIAASVVPMLSVTVRRLHDSGRSGTYYFMGFIPLAGPVLLLIALCAPSNPLPNPYGAPRRGVVADLALHHGF